MNKDIIIAPIPKVKVAGLVSVSTQDKQMTVRMIPIGGPPKMVKMSNIAAGDQFTVNDEYSPRHIYTAQKDAFYDKNGSIVIIAI